MNIVFQYESNNFSDVLTTNLVNEVIEWDHKENLNKPPCERTTNRVDALKHVISSCGISFNIWEKRNGDGSGSGLYEFTSLMGSDRVAFQARRSFDI